MNGFLWKVAIFVVSFTILLGLIYQRGYASGEAAVRAQMLSAQQKAVERIQALQRRLSELEKDAVERIDSNKKEQKIIVREVIRYVSRAPNINDCILDADGVRLWNAANTGEANGDSSPDGINAGVSKITAAD